MQPSYAGQAGQAADRVVMAGSFAHHHGTLPVDDLDFSRRLAGCLASSGAPDSRAARG